MSAATPVLPGAPVRPAAPGPAVGTPHGPVHPNILGLTSPGAALYRPAKAVTGRGGPHVVLRRLTVRYAVVAPLFVFAAWLFVTGALGPSS